MCDTLNKTILQYNSKGLQRLLASLRFIPRFNTAILPDAVKLFLFEMATDIFCRPNSILHICQNHTLLAYNFVYKASKTLVDGLAACVMFISFFNVFIFFQFSNLYYMCICISHLYK